MIHIVFEEANIQALKKSFDLDPSLEGEIVSIQDDYAAGPLTNIFTGEGMENRKQWWRDVLQGGPYDGIADDGHVDDNKAVDQLKQELVNQAQQTVWIWAAQNNHDVSGYYWLISQLKQFLGRIFILYLNNLPFINEKGNIFYPTSLFQILPKEFVKAKKLARAVTPSEFEIDPDEWTKLCNEDKGVRLLEGGKKLVQRNYDYYDAALLQFITNDWQKTNKLMTQFFSKSKEATGDAYLLWRLKKLAEEGKIECRGDFKNMKEFEVKINSLQNVEVDE